MPIVICVLLTAWGFIAALYGVVVFGVSQGAVHEIQAGLAFLIATVAFGLAGVIGAVYGNRPKRAKAEEHESVVIPRQLQKEF